MQTMPTPSLSSELPRRRHAGEFLRQEASQLNHRVNAIWDIAA